jgi:hypothetical protein
VAEEARLDVIRPQRLLQKEIRLQVDLPGPEVIGRSPVGVQQAKGVGPGLGEERRRFR